MSALTISINRVTGRSLRALNKLPSNGPNKSAALSDQGEVTNTSPMWGSRTMGDELNERFVARDPEAMRQIYAIHGAALYGAAYRILGDRSLAEEAVQQALLQAWRAADRFDPDRRLAPWLVTITKRAAIDAYRREKRHRSETLADHDAPAATIGMETVWEVYRVRRALDQLAKAEKEVLLLTHFNGMTHEDAAAHLDIPLGTVKSRSYRAYRKLTELLSDVEEVTP